MKKGISTLVASAMLFVSIPAVAAAAPTGNADIVSTVSFRSSPSTSANVLKYLKAGESVFVIEAPNSYWLKVRDDEGDIGYISSQEKYVSYDEPEQILTRANAVVVSSVSFRTEPSTSGDRIRYLSKDEQLVITKVVNGYWYEVKDASGVTGYVSSSEQYVKVTGELPQDSAPAGLAGVNAVVVSSVSFRNAPSTDGDRIRYLKKDEQIIITSKVNNYWYAVTDASGVAGFASTSENYIKLTGDLPQEPAPVVPSEPSEPSVPAISQQIEQVIAAGLKYLGTPYEFSSDRNTTTTFDCSDFVRQAFKDALNITLPADSRQQGEYVRDKNAVSTDWHSLKRGDLMFFMDYKGTKESSYASKNPMETRISHVGIYLGDGQVLQTYSVKSGGVRIDSIEGRHWEYRFLYGGSAL